MACHHLSIALLIAAAALVLAQRTLKKVALHFRRVTVTEKEEKGGVLR